MTDVAEELSDTAEVRPTVTPVTLPDARVGRVRAAVHHVRQGRYVAKTVKGVGITVGTPVVGTSKLTSTVWRWVRADDYGGAARESFEFLEGVRTRRRRTAWILGIAYVVVTLVCTLWWRTSAPIFSVSAIVGLGTAVETRRRLVERTTPLMFPGLGRRTPGENAVTRAAVAAKLGGVEGMKLATPVLTEESGWSTTLQLPPGTKARKAIGKEGEFASALGVGESQVVFELISEHAGRLTVYVAKSDPFLKVYPSPLLGRTDPIDFWAGVPAGVNGRGRAERLRLVDASLLVAGEPRAGKSAAVNGIIGAAALAVTPKIHLWDGKGAGDHRPWRRLAETSEKRNAAGLLEHLKRMQAQMEHVFDLLDEAGGSSKLTPELCRQLGVDIELTIIDELRYYVTSPQGDEIVEAAVDIASRGPAAAVLLVLATQRMTTDSLPGALKGVCSLRWCMRVPDAIASNAVLGAGAVGRGFDASEIPRSHRGVGILDADGADPIKLRSYFLDDSGPDLMSVAEAAYALRAAAGTLPARETAGRNHERLMVVEAFGEDHQLLPAEVGERLGWTREKLSEVLAGVPVRQLWRDGTNVGRGYRREDVVART